MSAFQSITSCFLVIASLQLPANSGFRLSKVPDTSTSSPPGMFEAAAVNTVHHKAHGTHKTGEEGSHRQRRHYSIDRQRRSVSGRGRHRPHRSSGAEIFQERLGADPWSSILGNPCRAEPTPRAFAQEEVLDVAGRESEIKLMSSGVIQALRVLKTDMVSKHDETGNDDWIEILTLSSSPQSVDECQDQFAETLPPLPNVTAALTTREFSVELLSDIYKSFYFLSAHFHFMRRDWLEGASCSRFPETLLPQLAR